jgi:FkbH-like protein
MTSTSAKSEPIKCVVWDLDNTVWRGVLLEDRRVEFKSDVLQAMRDLDERGILQSIASRNDYEFARKRLTEQGMWDLFLHPQVHWGPKSGSIQRISELLNIGLNTFAFIDDDPFERDEVKYQHREVTCVDPVTLPEFLRLPRAIPAFVTGEARMRRQMYQSEASRTQAREQCGGTDAEFLTSLNLRLEIRRATRDDLQRAEELTVRTNQLNSTGQTYSYDELEKLIASPDHIVLVSSLTDKYGPYGTIGLSLIARTKGSWLIQLLLMSCRVMSRGVGNVMLAYIMSMARRAGVTLRANFVSTDRNRMMYIAYKFAGFKEVDATATPLLLEANLAEAQRIPEHLEVVGTDLAEEPK